MKRSWSHQVKVSLHGGSVPGGQLEDVSLLDELVGGMDDVVLPTQHLVDLHQLLQVLLRGHVEDISVRVCIV